LRCSKFAANCITSKNFFRACLTLFSAFEKKTGLFSLSPSAFVHFINQTFIIKSNIKIHLSSYFVQKAALIVIKNSQEGQPNLSHFQKEN